jgi:PAS domain S-box-containing protein
MNPAALKFFELDSLEEALETPDTAFFSPEALKFTHGHREQRQYSERERSYEIDITTARGTAKRARITPIDVQDEDGEWLSTLVTLEDITASYLLSRQLMQSEHRFQSLVETNVAGIWRVRNPLDPRTEYMNEAMLRLLEIEHFDTALKANPWSFFTEKSLSVVIEEREKRQRGEGSFAYEVELISAKGNRRWGMVSPVDVYAQSGEWESTIVTILDLTEQHILEDQLLEREHLYETLTENTITPIWQTRPDGSTIYMNQAAANLLEIGSPEDGSSIKVDDILTPNARKILKHETRNRAKGEGSEYELEIVTRKGNRRYVHIAATPLITNEGEWLSSIATFIDRTEQKAKERETEKNLAMFEALVANMPEGILVEDPDHRVVAINDILPNIFNIHGGMAQAQAISEAQADGGEKYVASLTTDPEGYAEFVRSARSANEPIIEKEIVFRDGRSFEADYVPIYAPDGDLIAHLWKYRETTERKKIEQRLRESESQYRHLFQENPHPMWVLDWDTLEFLEVNHEAIERYGYTREEFLSMKLSDLRREVDRPSLTELISNMKLQQGSHHVEVVHRTKDGRDLIVDVVSNEIEFQGNGARLALAQDITERRKIENDLYRSRLNLNALVENTTDMISSYDREMRLITWNSAYENVFRNLLHVEIYAGMALRDRVPANEVEQWEQWMRRGLNGEEFVAERDYITPTATITMEVSCFPIVEEKVVTGVLFFNRDITSRKKTEAELLRSRANVHALVENTTDIISSFDTNLRLITWNSVLEEMMRNLMHMEIHEGMPLREMVSHEEVSMWDAWGKRGLNGEQFIEERFENDGAIVIEVSCFPINEDGKITGVMFFERDITKRKRTEVELIRSKANVYALVENSADMISSYDRDLKLITWNSAFENLFRDVLRIEIHEGMRLRDVVAPEEAIVWDAWGERGLNGERFIEQRAYTGAFPNTIEITVSPIIENGLVSGVMFFNKNITERKKTEAELLRSKANVYALVENTTDLISSFDQECKLITWNSAFENLFRNKLHIDLYEGMHLCDSIQPEEAAVRQQWMQRALRGEQFVEERTYADRILGTMEVSCFPIVENGVVVGVMFFERDITHRKRMERELVEAKERAEEMNRLKSSFLANMSHEIRTPMTAIQGFASLILESSREPEIQEFSEHILTGGKRLLSTINDILDLARIESKRIELNSCAVDLGHEVQNTAKLLEPLISTKDLRLQTLELKGHVICELDTRYFGQIITNLISNAIKFTDHGEITIEIDADEGEIPCGIVRIKDTGIGIKPENLRHLFDEFWQESQGMGRRYEGTGLGLAIVKKLTSLMSGEISVESIPDKGTTFTLRFPLALHSLVTMR